MSIRRRRLAQVLAGSALGASLTPRIWRALAQPPQGPTRFLAIRTPHGVDRDYWIPRESNGSDPANEDEALSALSFDYEDAILTPLMPWRDRITVLDGLDTEVIKEDTRDGVRPAHGHHEQGTLLTGSQAPSDRQGDYDGHPSLDFWMHDRLEAQVLLTVGVEGSSGWKAMSYDDGGRPRRAERSPEAAFRDVFPEDFRPPVADAPAVDYGPGEARILGFPRASLERLEGRIPPAEVEKVRAQLEALQRLEGQAGMPVAAMCTTTRADAPNDGPLDNYEHVTRRAVLHAGVIAQAFACDRARCATLEILTDFPNYYSDVPDVRATGARYNRFHEDLVHAYWGNAPANWRTAYRLGLRWSASNFAAVLAELDAHTDPLDPTGGTILENTIVFWHNEFGHDGHDNQHTRHPAIIAGGGGRVLRLGRYLRLRDIDSGDRVPHNKLLVSICHAMGLTDVDYFGDRDLQDDDRYRGPLGPLMA